MKNENTEEEEKEGDLRFGIRGRLEWTVIVSIVARWKVDVGGG